MLARGDAMGVFQFESSGMREALRQVRPTGFEDLIALVALYRPGPMGYIPGYAKRKNGQEQVTFIDERLKPITETTYGICIYQEQYMEIAKQLAGFSPAEADDLRKAIGKKIHSLMASLKDKFLEGCAQNGVSHGVATQLWKDTEQSQDYSFNKSHSAGYALIAYRTAYLKANYPHQYMAALISSVMNTKDRVPLYVNACREMGIEVEPPDVNESQTDFAVVEGKIRFGLNAVKNVGEGAAAAIVAAREDGPFESLWDLTERVDPTLLNKRALESLIKCGALDSLGHARRGNARRARQRARVGRARAGRSAARPGLDLRPRRRRVRLAEGAPDRSDRRVREGRGVLALEKESLGLYVSEHPLEEIKEQLRKKTDCALLDVAARRDGEFVTVGGIVGAVKQLTTRKGDPMVFLRLDDLTGSTEVVVFNSVYAASRELLEHDAILVVKGRVDHKQEGDTKLIAMEVTRVRGRAGRPRGAAAGRCGQGAGRADRRAEGDHGRLPGRDPGDHRRRHLARPEDARVRARAPREAEPGLLRRGQGAPRRSRRRLTPQPGLA